MGEVYGVFIPIFMGQSLTLMSYKKLLKTSSLISMDRLSRCIYYRGTPA